METTLSAEQVLKEFIPHGSINLKPGQEIPTIVAAMKKFAGIKIQEHLNKAAERATVKIFDMKYQVDKQSITSTPIDLK